MRVLYMGGGFVGACSAAVSADSGHETLVFDIDNEKVKKLSTDDRDVVESCIREDGLADLLIRNRARISFTSDPAAAGEFAETADVVFMCVPTPQRENGECDLSYYEKAVAMIAPPLARRTGRVVVVNKSTVPVHMIDYTKTLFERNGVLDVGIVSNPEFLAEGKAIEGSIRPDRVVVGALDPRDFAVMRRLYSRFSDSAGVRYIEVNPYEAAAGKLLANYLLFSKVVNTYDVVGRMAEHFPSLRFESLRAILTSDPRIGSWGLYDSMYAGGSCFIKDALSLAHQMEQAGASAGLIRGILEANTFQRDRFFDRAEAEAGFGWAGTAVAVLGLAFKQDTNDMRNSGAIGMIQRLLGAGVAEIAVYDPAAMDECKKYFDPNKNELNSRIRYAKSMEDALRNSHACMIATDWAEFKTAGEAIAKILKPPYLIMDGRRMIHAQYDELQKKGFDIIAVGSPFIRGL